MKRLSARLGLLMTLALAAAPALAQAQEARKAQPEEEQDKRARELYLQGDRAYAEGDYEGALAAFEEAYRLSGREALLYNMANAYERLGDYERAIEKLREFLPHAPAQQQAMIEKRLASLQVRMDAKRAERELEAEQQKKTPEKSAGTDQSTPPEPAGSAPLLGYALLGVGALGLGAGTYFGLKALDARSEAADRCVQSGGGNLCATDAEDAVEKDSRNAMLADIGFGIGIASAAVGMVLVLTHDGGERGREAAGETRLRAAGRPGGAAVDVVVQF